MTTTTSAQSHTCRDGLLVASVDLNMCRQVKDKWCLRVRIWINLFKNFKHAFY